MGKTKISFGGLTACGTRWGFYGEGNRGKTTLAIKYALRTKGKVAVLDAEGSVRRLKDKLASQGFDMSRILTIPVFDIDNLIDFLDERDVFKSENITAIVIDTMTVVDSWYSKFICDHFRNDTRSGGIVYSKEPYNPPLKTRESLGFGKDNTAAFEANEFILEKLDKHIDECRDVFLVMQQCDADLSDARVNAKTTIMRLQHPAKNQKYSIALRVKEWLDNLGYVFRHKEVDENGRTISYGDRMIAFQDYGTGIPGMDGTFWAKGRTISGVHAIAELAAVGKVKDEGQGQGKVKGEGQGQGGEGQGEEA